MKKLQEEIFKNNKILYLSLFKIEGWEKETTLISSNRQPSFKKVVQQGTLLNVLW